MKKVMTYISVITSFIAIIALTLLGLEIFGNMNADAMLAEAYTLGACLAVLFVCVVYKTASNKN